MPTYNIVIAGIIVYSAVISIISLAVAVTVEKVIRLFEGRKKN